MAREPLIVSFVGSSGVGKTTVVEQLVPLIRATGLTVGTVKHAPHGHEVDRIGSDSWRHRQAGADVVLLAGANGAVVFIAPQPGLAYSGVRPEHHAVDEAASTNRIVELAGRYLTGLDVVLAEGYSPLNDVLIEVHRREVPRKAPADRGEAWLAITDQPSGLPKEYGFEQLAAVAEHIVDLFRADRPDVEENHR